MSGARSSIAQATPFTTDAAPGPSVVRHAPGLRPISACAIAAMAAAVSVDVSANGRPARVPASIRSRLPPPPGTPKMQPTPASRRRRTMRSARVAIGGEHSTPSIISDCDFASFRRASLPAVELHQDLRGGVRDLCKAFPDSYWRALDAQRAYPDAFVRALTAAGYLAALIPEEYGGSGLGVTEASIILEEVNRSGANG